MQTGFSKDRLSNKTFQKNDIVTVTIEDIGSEGEGIGKVEGFTLFVKDAVPGDTVDARIVKNKKNYAYARLEKVLEPSPFRVEPQCAFHRQCGGCQLQALSYEKQLSFKQEKIRNSLIRVGGFSPEYVDQRMESIVGMEGTRGERTAAEIEVCTAEQVAEWVETVAEQRADEGTEAAPEKKSEDEQEAVTGEKGGFRYRNKALYPVGTDKNGNIVAGFYAGRTHDIIPNTNCLLGARENEEILNCILDYMREKRVSAYNEETGTGLVRHVLIRKGFTSGELMVCLVLNWKGEQEILKGAGQEKLQKEIRKGTKQEKSQKETRKIAQQEKLQKEAWKGAWQEKAQQETRKGIWQEQTHQEDAGGKRIFLPEQEELVSRLARIKGMTSVSVCINNRQTNVIMGEEVHTIWGRDTISDTIHMRDMGKAGYPYTGRELTFRISPLSFYQVNPVQVEKLYSIALEYAGLTGKETVWDLYCGIGTISLFLAGSARKVWGVEVIPEAIRDARENAERNGISNAEFFVGKAEDVLQGFYQERQSSEQPQPDRVRLQENPKIADGEMLHPDVIVVDPPRKGCDEACLDTMLKMAPERIVYVSCDPATLARDLRALCDGGYEIKRIRGTDMFSMTVHCETVALLSK